LSYQDPSLAWIIVIIDSRISKPKGLVLGETGLFDLIFIVESNAICVKYTGHIKKVYIK